MLRIRPLLFVMASCAPAAPTITAIPAPSSSALAVPTTSASTSASASASSPPARPAPSAVDVTFELVPPTGPESTPRDVFLVAPAIGLRAKVATYTLPEVCFSRVDGTPSAMRPGGPHAPTSVVVTCTNAKADVARLKTDGDALVLVTNGAEQRFPTATDAKVTFGALALPSRDCGKTAERPVSVAIRRHVRKSEPAFHGIWLESSGLDLKMRLGEMFHELGCRASYEGGGLELSCVAKVGPDRVYSLRQDGDWLTVDGATTTRLLLPCHRKVTFERYVDRALPPLAGATDD